jgi:hypothetical protein
MATKLALYLASDNVITFTGVNATLGECRDCSEPT